MIQLILSAFLIFSSLAANPTDLLHQANTAYQQGEKATSFEERRLAFNQALYHYHLAEQQVGQRSSLLNKAVGDSFFQLEEYPWAVLYYQRALKSDPHNSLVLSQLNRAYEKLGLPPPVSSSNTLKQTLLLEPFFTLSQRFKWFFWSALAAFLICSLVIWRPSPRIRKIALGFLIITGLIAGNVLYSSYFTPLDGIIVSSTGFYREPDDLQPQLTNEPLLAGTKVQILQSSSQGDWLKIADSTGLVGYVPAARIRII